MFADVGFSSHESDLREPIDNLPNLGPTSIAWLREVGIGTIADLEAYGPVAAYRLVKLRQPGATLNLLWSLAAGLQDKDWRKLSEEEKQSLLAQMESD